MRAVAERGLCLSRHGRCELKLALARSGLAQVPVPSLQRRLHEVLKSRDKRVLVCIPRVFEGFPDLNKEHFYAEFTEPEVVRHLFHPDKEYGSTFVSRSDGWIGDMDEDAYWQLVRGIWQGRPVLLIAGSGKGKGAAGDFLANARSVDVLDAPERDAWASYKGIRKDCLAWAATKDRPLVYAALGATAAVLCHDLAAHGIQGLDLGHMAQSWRRSDMKKAS